MSDASSSRSRLRAWWDTRGVGARRLAARIARARSLRDSGRADEALELLQELYRRLSAQPFGEAHAEVALLAGDCLRHRGSLPTARDLLEAALGRAESGLGAGHRLTCLLRNSLGLTHEEAGRLVEATACFERNVAEVAADDATRFAFRANLADTYARQGRLDDALVLLRTNRREQEASGADASQSAFDEAMILMESGRQEAAIALARQAIEDRHTRFGAGARQTLQARLVFGTALRRAGLIDEAEGVITALVVEAERELGPLDRVSLRAANQLAILQEARGSDVAAETWRDILQRAESGLGVADRETRDFRRNAADNLMQTGRFDEASLLWAAEATCELSDVAVAQPGAVHVEVLRRLGRDDEARAWLTAARERLAAGRGLGAGEEPDPRGLGRWQAVTAMLADLLWPTDPSRSVALWDEARRDVEAGLGADDPLARTCRLSLAAALDDSEQAHEAAGVWEAERASCARRGDAAGQAEMLVLLAEHAWRRGDREDAADLLAARSALVSTLHGPDDARTLSARVAHALAVAGHGDPAAAAPLLDAVLESTSLHYDLHEIDVLARRARAEVAGLMGEHERALGYAADALADVRDLLGDAAPETRRALLGYALAAERAGEWGSAREALAVHVQHAPDPEAPDVVLARTRLHLAGEAAPESAATPWPGRDEVRRALAVWIRDEGEDDEATLQIRWELADSLVGRGRLAEAVEEFDHLAQEHRLAGRLEMSLAACNRMALTLEDLGHADETEETLRQAVATAAAELGPTATMAATLRHNLADTLERRGDLDGAAWLFGHNVVEQTPPDRTPVAAVDARRRLAWTLLLSERVPQAMLVARRALAEAEATLTPGHDATLDARNTLALCLERLGEAEQAQELYEANLVEGESALGRAHAAVLPYRNNLARMYYEAGRKEEALALYRVSAEVVAVELAQGRARDVEVLRHLGDCLLATGDAAGAADVLYTYVRGLVMGVGVEHERTHRARTLWARAIRGTGRDLREAAAAHETETRAGAYEAAALLHVAGDLAGEARVRLRHDLADPLDDDEGEIAALHRRLAEEIAFATSIGRLPAGEHVDDLLAPIAHSATVLPPGDGGRAMAMIAWAVALHGRSRPQAARDVMVDELEAIHAAGLWGCPASDRCMGMLLTACRAGLDWTTHDEWLALDFTRLEETVGFDDERTIRAAVRLAAAFRRRGEGEAARRLLAQARAHLSAAPTDGLASLLAIAEGKVAAFLAFGGGRGETAPPPPGSLPS